MKFYSVLKSIEREASSLTVEEIERIYEATVTTLGEAVKRGGSTIRTYINSQGQIGSFQELLNVYGKRRAVRNLWYDIRKTVVGGRGTHYCPICQPRI